MKTAVSVPDELFQEAEKLAESSHTSRSRLFSDALREYIDRHAPMRVTQRMNATLADIDDSTDAFVKRSARRILEQTEW